MKIIRRITLEHDKHIDHRIYLVDEDGRVVSLDTADRLEDADAIVRAEELLAAESVEPDGLEMIALGDSLADTMATVIAIHEGRGDAVEYSD